MSGTRRKERKRFLCQPSCCKCNAETVARHHSESSVVDWTKWLVRHGGPGGGPYGTRLGPHLTSSLS